MKRVLVLGATGRSGSAVISHLSGRVEIVAGLRTEVDRSRLPGDACIAGTALVDLASIASVQRAMRDMDAVVNAIRLREDIPATALVDLHRLILDAAPGAHPPLIATVGGAGSLHLPGQRRFWQSSAFPARTLPRGRAHAELLDHLEAGYAGQHWAYLIPPPPSSPKPRPPAATGCGDRPGTSWDSSAAPSATPISPWRSPMRSGRAGRVPVSSEPEGRARVMRTRKPSGWISPGRPTSPFLRVS